jgi:hypothetical protein
LKPFSTADSEKYLLVALSGLLFLRTIMTALTPKAEMIFAKPEFPIPISGYGSLSGP